MELGINTKRSAAGRRTSYNNGDNVFNHFARDVGELDAYVLTWSVTFD